MNVEDRLRQMVKAARAEGRTSEAEWSRFAQRAHRSLFARRVMAVAAAVLLVGGGAVAASVVLGDDPTMFVPGPPAATPTDQATPEQTQAPTPGPSEVVGDPTVEPFDAELWLVQDRKLSPGSRVIPDIGPPATSTGDPLRDKVRVVLQTLLAGPIASDVEAGATTAIPTRTRLFDVQVVKNTAIVDLSRDFVSPASERAQRLREAQIVYTVTQFAGVDTVGILIAGEPLTGAGAVRRDFKGVAPPIVLEDPQRGEEAFAVAVPVSGFANVYEGTVVMRLTVDGRKIAETFTTATCGSGCWGDFAKPIKFDVDERVEAQLEVFSPSAEDGSEQHMVVVPVALVPSVTDG